MSFIRTHLVTSIQKKIKQKQDSINFSGFFYFDEKIKDNKRDWLINRVNDKNAYPHEKVYPLTFWTLDAKALVDLYGKIKNNDFYFYKRVNGKDHKIRLKRNENIT